MDLASLETLLMSLNSPDDSEVIAALAVNPDSDLIPVARANGILTAMVFPRGGLIGNEKAVLKRAAFCVVPRRTDRLSAGRPRPCACRRRARR